MPLAISQQENKQTENAPPLHTRHENENTAHVLAQRLAASNPRLAPALILKMIQALKQK